MWRRENVVLAHRRLAVIDRSPEAAQPMLTCDGGSAIVYNGELYNDAEVREALVRDGWARGFRTRSDTETVLAALVHWGEAGLARLRGMFALGFVDLIGQRLVLARDPLGIKPLYYSVPSVEGCDEVVFASEPRAILGHPSIAARPDFEGISAYLTTIRTTIGRRTLFEGVCTLMPGEVRVFELSGTEGGRLLAHESQMPLRGVRELASTALDGALERGANDDPVASVRRVVRDSVHRHLRADVPICALLSGGLDSTIIAACAAECSPGDERGAMRTFCSGARTSQGNDDFDFARAFAVARGWDHTEAPVTRELFAERWRAMVEMLGVPLSTPNEVAINEVARVLRRQGCVVALSGEGADELFGGYDQPMRQALAFEAVRRTGLGVSRSSCELDPGLHHLKAAAWVTLEAKGSVLREGIAHKLNGDAVLIEQYQAKFAEIERGVATDDRGFAIEPLEPHLRFLRSVNLSGLLARLDTSTMLASVEGRTPFADRVVAARAESLPMAWKYASAAGVESASPGRGGSSVVVQGGVVTKRVLREAFADVVPESIVSRPKASFPLPFESWTGVHAETLRRSVFAREVFSDAAIELVAASPELNWRLAWPMMNIAMWGERWWG